MQQRNDPELDVSTIFPANCRSFDFTDVLLGSLTKSVTQVRKDRVVRGAKEQPRKKKMSNRTTKEPVKSKSGPLACSPLRPQPKK